MPVCSHQDRMSACAPSSSAWTSSTWPARMRACSSPCGRWAWGTPARSIPAPCPRVRPCFLLVPPPLQPGNHVCCSTSSTKPVVADHPDPLDHPRRCRGPAGRAPARRRGERQAPHATRLSRGCPAAPRTRRPRAAGWARPSAATRRADSRLPGRSRGDLLTVYSMAAPFLRKAARPCSRPGPSAISAALDDLDRHHQVVRGKAALRQRLRRARRTP